MRKLSIVLSIIIATWFLGMPVKTQAADCVDGSIQQGLSVVWASNSSVNIVTSNNLPLCNDINLVFSSYTMPDNYNGQGFYNNPTSTPQSIFSTVSTTLKEGTDGSTNISVNLPNPCKNVQVDLYYAPEIDTVGINGHGTQNITSKVYTSSGTCPSTAMLNNPVSLPVGTLLPSSIPDTGDNGYSTLLKLLILMSATFAIMSSINMLRSHHKDKA